MKLKIFALFSLLAMSLGAQADGFFIGGHLNNAIYPQWVDSVNNSNMNLGASYTSSTQKLIGVGLGIKAGQWFQDGHLGWEIGYDNLGHSTVDNTATFAGFTASESIKYGVKAFHLALLAGSDLGRRASLFGKFGIYRASETADYDLSQWGLGTGSFSASNSGLLLGIGTDIKFAEHWAGSIGLDLLNGVKFNDAGDINTNPAGPINTTNKNMFNLSFGLNYRM